jgi:16S rRNA (guanine966-N2)-methyltransferase
VFKYTKMPSRSFDIIFADPPYDFTPVQLESLISESFKNGLVSKEGTFILEHSKHTDVSAFERFSESRRYGGSVFSFFE